MPIMLNGSEVKPSEEWVKAKDALEKSLTKAQFALTTPKLVEMKTYIDQYEAEQIATKGDFEKKIAERDEEIKKLKDAKESLVNANHELIQRVGTTAIQQRNDSNGSVAPPALPSDLHRASDKDLVMDIFSKGKK